MSGHSHAKNVAHQKGLANQKKGRDFSKAARLISVAVKEGGIKIETNSKLKSAIEVARTFSMPTENIERAIKSAAGGQEGKDLSEVIFEAFGPGGTALLIEGITDNKNRTLGEIKQILSQYNGKLAQEGSVRWLFERKGVILVDANEQNPGLQEKEKLELLALESGAEDFEWEEKILVIYALSENLSAVRLVLEKEGMKINSSSVEWQPKEKISVPAKEEEQLSKLFDALDESGDVQNVYSNLLPGETS